MDAGLPHTEARERVLNAAEQLFAQKGYAAVTLRDVGARAGIHHSSLYHHVPAGKEALFVEVTERIFARHQAGLNAAIRHAEPNVRAQLNAVADWLLSQPPMDQIRMTYSDMPALTSSNAQRLADLGYAAMIVPVAQALVAAQGRGEIAYDDVDLAAGGLIGMIESLYGVTEQDAGKTRRTMAHKLIDLVLDGLRAR